MKKPELIPMPPLRLSGLIDALRMDTQCSSATAAYFFSSTFQAVKDFTDAAYLLPERVCWVGHLESSAPREFSQVWVPSLIAYFESRMTSLTTTEDFVACSKFGTNFDVPDHLVYFDPVQLAQLIEHSGAEVPGFLSGDRLRQPSPDHAESGKDSAKRRTRSGVDSMEIRELKTAHKITRLLIKILVAASHRDGASIRQRASQLGQKGQLYADARILREIAETLGLDLPKKNDTLVKYLESPEGEDD